MNELTLAELGPIIYVFRQPSRLTSICLVRGRVIEVKDGRALIFRVR